MALRFGVSATTGWFASNFPFCVEFSRKSLPATFRSCHGCSWGEFPFARDSRRLVPQPLLAEVSSLAILATFVIFRFVLFCCCGTCSAFPPCPAAVALFCFRGPHSPRGFFFFHFLPRHESDDTYCQLGKPRLFFFLSFIPAVRHHNIPPPPPPPIVGHVSADSKSFAGAFEESLQELAEASSPCRTASSRRSLGAAVLLIAALTGCAAAAVDSLSPS